MLPKNKPRARLRLGLGKLRLGKRAGTTEQDEMLSWLQILIIFVVLLAFAGAFGVWYWQQISRDECRVTMIANSFRVPDQSLAGYLWGSGKTKERVPVVCPRLPDLEIKYEDVEASSPTVMKSNTMRILAEEERKAHIRAIGDLKGVVPFSSQTGVYCVIGREVGMEPEINSVLVEAKDTSGIGPYLTFKMNQIMQNPRNTYAEYLYGFKKDTTEDVRFNTYFIDRIQKDLGDQILTEKEKKAISDAEIYLDPTKRHYVMHVILKGEDVIAKKLGEDRATIITDLSFTGAICTGSYALTLISGSVGAWPVTLMSGLATLACYGSTAVTIWDVFSTKIGDTEEEQPMIRFTTTIPVDELKNLGCDRVYGLERAEEPEKLA